MVGSPSIQLKLEDKEIVNNLSKWKMMVIRPHFSTFSNWIPVHGESSSSLSNMVRRDKNAMRVIIVRVGRDEWAET